MAQNKPSERTIKTNLNNLRKLIDTTDDELLARVAYAMETAVRWATEDTNWGKNPNWFTDEAKTLTKIAREYKEWELKKGKR